MEQIEKKYDLSHRDVLKEETKNEITELDNSIRQLKEDIYNLANKINICTIYSLRGNLNEEN